MKKGLIMITLVLAFTAGVSAVLSCGIDFTFRAYLDKRFWQPFARYVDSKGGSEGRGQHSPAEGQGKDGRQPPYAGMESKEDRPALQKVRLAYQGQDYDQARIAIKAALAGTLTAEEREELLLVDVKSDMREGEAGNDLLLRQAKGKFLDFVQHAAITSRRSEARGWLARVHYLLGEYAPAAKIYLDEMSSAESMFSQESLVNSLRMLYPYNGSSVRLADHLEEYFDTPGHALFVVNIVTNPIYYDKIERAAMAGIAQSTIAALKKHPELFTPGPESEALALALMRAALYMGDPQSALAYAKLVPEGSATSTRPDFNWMTASCYFLQRRYQEAEAPLLTMLHFGQATNRDRNAAAQGLVGVYQKLGRRLDQLHAAFLSESEAQKVSFETLPGDSHSGDRFDYGFQYYWPAGGWCLDLSYLLDIQLTDEELLGYLKRYAKPARAILLQNGKRRRTAYEMVEYALAVRYAREERFQEAADILTRLQSWPRAKRMQEIALLHAATVEPGLSPQDSLQAQYAYAAFLESHGTRIFFNDMLWKGYQTWTFLGKGVNRFYGGLEMPVGSDAQGLTREERVSFLERERKIKDAQEERWRAYQILVGIVDQAGATTLGRQAAEKAFRCLVLISPERFGRVDEIAKAKTRLANWLVQHGQVTRDSN